MNESRTPGEPAARRDETLKPERGTAARPTDRRDDDRGRDESPEARGHGEDGGAGRAGGVETGGEWAQPRTSAASDGPTDWEHHDPAVSPHPESVRSTGTAATGAAAATRDPDPGPAGTGAVDPDARPRAGSGAVEARVSAPGGGAALFSDEERRRLHARWNELQGTFIDDPRHSVTEADHLVRDTIGSLHDLFERDRVQLEAVWSRGEEVSTEDLRLTLQRYRSFFDRLLSV